MVLMRSLLADGEEMRIVVGLVTQPPKLVPNIERRDENGDSRVVSFSKNTDTEAKD